MLKMFGALPAYFGGKRRLANQIMRYAEGKTFIDAFMGGGSVAVLAKARGFRVLANDIADRSAIVGRALIENADIYIEDEDIARLFLAHAADRHYIRDHQGHMFKPEIAEFLDRARANIEDVRESAKRALLLLLWVRVIMYYRPMGSFTHPRAVEDVPVKHAHFYGFGFNENAGGQEVLLVGRPR